MPKSRATPVLWSACVVVCVAVAASAEAEFRLKDGPYLPPHGGGGCTSDWNCSLGGECVHQECVCDPWFTGSNCSYLNLQRAKPNAGFQVPGFHSWGGHSVFDSKAQVWRGFFSFMVRRCTLSAWTTNSATVHATAPDVDGPYTLYQNPNPDTLAPSTPALVIPPWSHNTYLTRDPPTGEWLLWHIGSGQTPPAEWKNCSSSDVASSSHQIPSRGNAERDAATPLAGDTFYVATAKALTGPWNVSNFSSVDVNEPPDAGRNYWAHHKSNPAPFIFPNGSAMVFFSSQDCPKNWPGALAPACIGMAVASTWRGPYTAVGLTPITAPESEDPSVFQDPRGNFHLLTNVNNAHKHCASGVACGGHAFSRDALTWSDLFVGAFGPVITFTNGTVYNAAYVERPQVVQNADRTPLAFFVGTGIGVYTNSVSWAQKFCTADMEDSDACGPTVAG
eukprot:m.174123 g.174123  ORF g.174123 m.174123 type:complete len:448 (+) comp18321_c0_seq3:89-1432(+)